mmetsp:Transcript_18727/g.35138  ORF Transcript_18727/g.35138 Transcript_18727/m.35138 type:complete len:247 (+) Transcript_18727:698-1438(+)
MASWNSTEASTRGSEPAPPVISGTSSVPGWPSLTSKPRQRRGGSGREGARRGVGRVSVMQTSLSWPATSGSVGKCVPSCLEPSLTYPGCARTMVTAPRLEVVSWSCARSCARAWNSQANRLSSSATWSSRCSTECLRAASSFMLRASTSNISCSFCFNPRSRIARSSSLRKSAASSSAMRFSLLARRPARSLRRRPMASTSDALESASVVSCTCCWRSKAASRFCSTSSSCCRRRAKASKSCSRSS